MHHNCKLLSLHSTWPVNTLFALHVNAQLVPALAMHVVPSEVLQNSRVRRLTSRVVWRRRWIAGQDGPGLVGEWKKKDQPTTSPWLEISTAAPPVHRVSAQPTRYKTNEAANGNRIGNNKKLLCKLKLITGPDLTWLLLNRELSAKKEAPLLLLFIPFTQYNNDTAINVFDLPSGPFERCVAGNGAHVYGYAPISPIQDKSIQNGRRLRLQLAALALRIELPMQGLPQRSRNPQRQECGNLRSRRKLQYSVCIYLWRAAIGGGG